MIDNASTDGTVEWSEEAGYDVIRQTKTGLRHGYNEAIPHISGDYVITFSPDGNSIPELIPELVSKIKEGFDMVIVSRYLGNAKSYDDTLLSAAGNWLFTKSINFLHGGKYTDTLGLFRAYDHRLVDGQQSVSFLVRIKELLETPARMLLGI